MYVCNECNSHFEQPNKTITTFEKEFGVSQLFNSSHRIELLLCPICSSENIDELQVCDACGEFCQADELQDTEGAINGGIGYVCPQCIEDCEIRFI